MTYIINLIVFGGTILGVMAFLCFVMLLCGAIAKVTWDLLHWIFN